MTGPSQITRCLVRLDDGTRCPERAPPKWTRCHGHRKALDGLGVTRAQNRILAGLYYGKPTDRDGHWWRSVRALQRKGLAATDGTVVLLTDWGRDRAGAGRP